MDLVEARETIVKNAKVPETTTIEVVVEIVTEVMTIVVDGDVVVTTDPEVVDMTIMIREDAVITVVVMEDTTREAVVGVIIGTKMGREGEVDRVIDSMMGEVDVVVIAMRKNLQVEFLVKEEDVIDLMMGHHEEEVDVEEEVIEMRKNLPVEVMEGEEMNDSMVDVVVVIEMTKTLAEEADARIVLNHEVEDAMIEPKKAIEEEEEEEEEVEVDQGIVVVEIDDMTDDQMIEIEGVVEVVEGEGHGVRY